MKSDEAFMLELQPHVERTVQKICSALGKQGDATAAQDVATLLKEEASHAIKVLAEKGRMTGREEQESTLHRARILRKAPSIADQMMKSCGLDLRQPQRLQKRIAEDVVAFDQVLFTLWDAGRQEERERE